MEPTHYLYLTHPPRPTFVRDVTPAEAEILGKHFAWLEELLTRGKLLLAGPCLDGACGLAILKVTDPAEAQLIGDSDPAVIGRLFTSELHPLHVGMMATGSGAVSD